MPQRVTTHSPVRPATFALARKRERCGFYDRRAWRGTDRRAGVRRIKLDQDPLCERCKSKGLLVPATQVHHKVDVRASQDDALDLGNLESLCASCHSAETASRTHAARSSPNQGGLSSLEA